MEYTKHKVKELLALLKLECNELLINKVCDSHSIFQYCTIGTQKIAGDVGLYLTLHASSVPFEIWLQSVYRNNDNTLFDYGDKSTDIAKLDNIEMIESILYLLVDDNTRTAVIKRLARSLDIKYNLGLVDKPSVKLDDVKVVVDSHAVDIQKERIKPVYDESFFRDLLESNEVYIHDCTNTKVCCYDMCTNNKPCRTRWSKRRYTINPALCKRMTKLVNNYNYPYIKTNCTNRNVCGIGNCSISKHCGIKWEDME